MRMFVLNERFDAGTKNRYDLSEFTSMLSDVRKQFL